MSRNRSGVLLTGLAVGLAAGWWWSQLRQGRHREALFSASRSRRRAALGWLAGDVRADTVRLLREYVRWESDARLKRRGAALLARLERDLGVAA